MSTLFQNFIREIKKIFIRTKSPVEKRHVRPPISLEPRKLPSDVPKFPFKTQQERDSSLLEHRNIPSEEPKSPLSAQQKLDFTSLDITKIISEEEVQMLRQNLEKLTIKELKEFSLHFRIPDIPSKATKKFIIDRILEFTELNRLPLDLETLAYQGEEVLRQELSQLTQEQLKHLIKHHSMPARQRVLKWKDSNKVIDYIVEVAMSRVKKGDRFLPQG